MAGSSTMLRRAGVAALLAMLAIAPALVQNCGSLYRASANGHTMLLFGTAHLSDPAVFPTDPMLLDAVGTASTLYLESTEAPSIFKLAYLFKEPTYQALPEATRQRLLTQLQRTNTPEGLGLRLSPLVLASHIETKLCPEPGAGSEPVDLRLAALAHSHHVPVVSIEKPNDTMDLINAMPADAKRDLIEQMLAKVVAPGHCASAQAELQGWLDADFARIEADARKMRDDDSPSGRWIYQALVRGRDAKMAPKIAEALANQDKAVVAVGVAHLTGEGSIIDLLRERGIAVERVY